MKKLLFNRDSECIQPLRELIEQQKHRTLAMWAVDCSGPVLNIFERRYPAEKRPYEAIEAAKAWMHGEIKMPVAKAAIHAAHNAATEVEHDAAACAAARAMGHAAATVHVETHALGLVFYGLTAVVYSTEANYADEAVAKELKRYTDRLLHWEANIENAGIVWAPFLLRDDLPNKERLLRQKKEQKR
jgi:hypothetical protein